MFVICGLGNPGKKYENTRHNLGFITMDRLAEKMGISIKKSKFKSLIGEGTIGGEKIVLVKPQTFMNNSGEALREVMSFYKIPYDNLLVVYDDIDIPLGTVRIRKGGSAGTHNGMKSVIYHLEEDDFPRIRLGLGHASSSERKGDLVDFVIGGFTKEEVKPLEEACDTAVDAIICYIKDGIDIAMTRYNTHRKKEEDKKDQ